MSPNMPRLASTTAVESLCLCTLPGNAATYTYLRPEWADSERDPYGVALLKLAFAKAGVCHTLVYSKQNMKQGRAVYELERDSGKLDIMITMTSPEREAALLGVPVPLTKGVLGWRIALVRKERLHQFAAVREAGQLKKFVAGQGHDWPDTAILRANGLPVEVSSAYDGMFKMLEAGRIDYFPRAVQQVFAEHKEHPSLALEPHIVLRYPTDAYFFVNRRNTRLAADVRRGLRAPWPTVPSTSFSTVISLRRSPPPGWKGAVSSICRIPHALPPCRSNAASCGSRWRTCASRPSSMPRTDAPGRRSPRRPARLPNDSAPLTSCHVLRRPGAAPAAFGAIPDLVPVALPFLAPAEGKGAVGAGLHREARISCAFS